jgi:chemosensory pili system protein ChpA (sensor histidine kinase/response regulator)
MMAESVNDVATVQRTLQKTVQATEDDLSVQARQTRELQRGLLRTRMVEFEGISDRLYRVVRQASKDTGKQVRLDIVGGSIEMDRGVLDRMTPAFEHLLRNCVAHGIEDAAAREKAGKDASGLIVIDLHHEGNDVSVSFRDDGAGLDHKRIAERARTLGLLGHDQELSPEEATELIFKPGFSTAGQVSELAGRGIGMDVVRSQIAALGGRIETHSTPGQGTTFKLVLPLTTAVTHVVMLRAGEVSIGVPSNLVELVQRVSAADLETAYRGNSHPFGSEQVPFYWAGALLQHSRAASRWQQVQHHRHRAKRGAARGAARGRSAGQPGSRGQEPRPAARAAARPGRHLGAGLGRGGADLQPGGAGRGAWRPGARAAGRGAGRAGSMPPDGTRAAHPRRR